MSKATEVNSHYSVAPYYYFELATPGVHQVLKSYDTLGGPATNGVMLMSKKFRDANPKVTSAVYAALSEAEEFINKNAGRAAQIYIKTTNEKRSTPSRHDEVHFRPRQRLDDSTAAVDGICHLHAQGRHHEAAAGVVEGHVHAGSRTSSRAASQTRRPIS